MGGEKCLEYPCIMQSNLLDEEYSAILRYGNLLFARSSVEMFFEHGRQWKENFESLIYSVLCGNRFFESIHISQFCRNFASKIGNSIFVSSKFNSKKPRLESSFCGIKLVEVGI